MYSFNRTKAVTALAAALLLLTFKYFVQTVAKRRNLQIVVCYYHSGNGYSPAVSRTTKVSLNICKTSATAAVAQQHTTAKEKEEICFRLIGARATPKRKRNPVMQQATTELISFEILIFYIRTTSR